MDDLIAVHCKNNGITKHYQPGVTAFEVLKDMNIQMKYLIANARINNKTEGLNFKIYKPKDIEFLDLTDSSAMRTYVRTLCFVMSKAVEDLFPNSRLRLEHPICKGYFCTVEKETPITAANISAIKIRMQEIIDQDIPIEYIQTYTSSIIELFRSKGAIDKVRLLESQGSLYMGYYKMDSSIDYYNGGLLRSSGSIHLFDLMQLENGILLRIPSRIHPMLLEDVEMQPKTLEVFDEHVRWNKIMNLESVGDFNLISQDTRATDMIKVSEALHEKKISYIADDIYAQRKKGKKLKFVLVSGPSSSGKTTFSKRLSIQLLTNGLKPVAISLDNYFVDRVNTPRDSKGDYDFESLYALDLDFFNQQLQELVEGKTIELPTYSFETGKRVFKGNKLQVNENDILIIEGIHALNPDLTPLISDEMKYRIYVSALTTISLDDHNWIPTTDNRLLRRIIRDFRYRGYSARDTIQRWPSVRSGEDKWIFPYQENADAMFNSALLFELAVIKKYVEPILMEVPQNCEEYAEARRLLSFLTFIKPIHDREIPPTSLLREFLGGSSFRY